MQNNIEDEDIAMANKITAIRKATENSVRQSPAVIRYQKTIEKFYIGLAISACVAKSMRIVLSKLN